MLTNFTTSRFFLTGLVACSVALPGFVSVSSAGAGCGNKNKNPYCSPCKKTCAGANKFLINGGIVSRPVRDLDLFEQLPGHNLTWTRTGYSRVLGDRPGVFGDGHDWMHDYWWKVTRTSSGDFVICPPRGGKQTFVPTAGDPKAVCHPCGFRGVFGRECRW